MTQIDYDQKERERGVTWFVIPKARPRFMTIEHKMASGFSLNSFTLFIEIDENSKGGFFSESAMCFSNL